MPSLNKLAIERAQTRLNCKINIYLKEWEKRNPPPCLSMSNYEIASIAFSDPEWRVNALKAIKIGDSWRCSDQLREMSPKANAAFKKNAEKRKAWDELRYAKELEKKHEADKLIDRFVIGGASAQDLVKAIEEF